MPIPRTPGRTVKWAVIFIACLAGACTSTVDGTRQKHCQDPNYCPYRRNQAARETTAARPAERENAR